MRMYERNCVVPLPVRLRPANSPLSPHPLGKPVISSQS
jgi:hypothetical protein